MAETRAVSVNTLLASAAKNDVLRQLLILVGIAASVAVGVAAVMWSQGSDYRTLYTSLPPERASAVVDALNASQIPYRIQDSTGAIMVPAEQLHDARIRLAGQGLERDGSGMAMLEQEQGFGVSEFMQSKKYHYALEQELASTIESLQQVRRARVHLAIPKQSVFVRDRKPSSASIMLDIYPGRDVSKQNVSAIVNLVAGSVPGLSIDAVRVVDQHGKLLTGRREGANSERLNLQTQMEAKLTAQVDQLLAPMIGANAFSSQVQVELDMNEVTSARESYDKDGVVRRETTQETQMPQTQAGGIPGATANTPPADPELADRAPQDTPPEQATQGPADVSASRTYELGREVSVSNLTPGALKHVSVAVAIDKNALANASQADIKNIEKLVSAAVGAREERGDIVTVVTRPFTEVTVEEPPFYETGWFAMVVRNAVALLAVLLVLLVAVRPALKMLRGKGGKPNEKNDPATAQLLPPDGEVDREGLDAQIQLAQRIAHEQPQDAVMALRRMLAEPMTEGAAR